MMYLDRQKLLEKVYEHGQDRTIKSVIAVKRILRDLELDVNNVVEDKIVEEIRRYRIAGGKGLEDTWCKVYNILNDAISDSNNGFGI